jgi:hypothetical protein
MSAVKGIKFISNRMLYKIEKGHWCYIIVLNVRAQIENNIDDMKESVYEELERLFEKLPNHL